MRLTDGILMGVVAGLIGIFSLTLASPAHAQRGGTVSCGSKDGKYGRCNVPWRDARMIRQDSDSACVRGQTWGVDQRGLWVDRGCRGVFAEVGHGPGGSHGHGGWRPGPGWDRDIRLECASQSNRYQMCQVDVGRQGRVRLTRQVSQNRCSEGYSWGWNRAGVWVNHGCRGEFVVDRRW